MTPRRALLVTSFVTFTIAIGAVYLGYVREARDRLEPVELSRNAALSRPDWANYQEDIKAHLGATAVAQWTGKPISAALGNSQLEVVFDLEGPWIERNFVLPVLARTALGDETRHARYQIDSPRVVYYFDLPETRSGSSIPWVAIRYPHHERRLMLDGDGRWVASDG